MQIVCMLSFFFLFFGVHCVDYGHCLSASESDPMCLLQMTGAFPCDVSVFDINLCLLWLPVEGNTHSLQSLGVYTDGVVLYCR